MPCHQHDRLDVNRHDPFPLRVSDLIDTAMAVDSRVVEDFDRAADRPDGGPPPPQTPPTARGAARPPNPRPPPPFDRRAPPTPRRWIDVGDHHTATVACQ